MTGPAEDLKRAAALYSKGEIEKALDICRTVLAVEPDSLQAINLLGGILTAQGAYDEAIAALKQGLALRPDNAMIRRNLSAILLRLRRPKEALSIAEPIVDPSEDDARLLVNAAILLHPHDRESAGKALGRAYAAQKTVVIEMVNEWLSTYGRTLKDDQLATLTFLYELCPSIREIGLFLMDARRVRHRLDHAISIADEIVDRHPDFFEAHFNRGLLLYNSRRFADAARAFEQAAELRPDSLGALARAAYAWTRCADWNNAERDTDLLREKIRAAQKTGPAPDISPYTAVALNLPLDMQLAVARARASSIESAAPPVKARPVSMPSPEKRPLRIAYLSADFHNHATAHLICDLFACHDRSRFHVTGYSYGPDVEDDYRMRIVAGCDDFVDIRDLDDSEAARRLVDDGIDIAVDLKGYTFGARPGILARRPAPIQVAYLGFPGSMGADFIDYVISDRVVTPPEDTDFYSEKIVFMPDCYQVNAADQAIDPTPLTRKDVGLPSGRFIFCCFNRANKIDRESFSRWMAVLRQVPESVLWLYGAHEEANASLSAAAKKAGTDPGRLIFAPSLKKAQHLARLALADLFLDTRHISAHTTASDCLWAGVPLLAIPGHAFIGRVSASLLTAMGLDDMIARDDADYIAKAVTLAQDPDALAALKSRVARARSDSSLFRPDLFARGLEAAYGEMWEIHASGKNPRDITVSGKTR